MRNTLLKSALQASLKLLLKLPFVASSIWITGIVLVIYTFVAIAFTGSDAEQIAEEVRTYLGLTLSD